MSMHNAIKMNPIKEEIDQRISVEKEKVSYERYLIQKRQLFNRIIILCIPVLIINMGLLLYLYWNNNGSFPVVFSSFSSTRFSFYLLLGISASFLLGIIMFAFLQLPRYSNSTVPSDKNYTQLKFYLEDRVSQMQKMLNDEKKIKFELNSDDRDKVLAAMQTKLESSAVQSYVDSIKDLIGLKVKEDTLEIYFENITRRLYGEIDALSQRASLNLILGSIVTVIGIVILSLTVLNVAKIQNSVEIFAYFIPKISLVVMIEIFAFFFLRLYKQTFSEIKYFQNELTNVEVRKIALYFAFREDDITLRGKVIDELSKTERNFILAKGQTTVGIEREMHSDKDKVDLINLIKEICKCKSVI